MNLEPARPSGCSKHPEEPVTGFCASCLRERLAGFDPKTRRIKPTAPSSTATTASAIKSLFKPSTSRNLLELRRSKSFSAARGNAESFSGVFEPQRRSCDVRVRSTLSSLFHQDDENNGSCNGNNGYANGGLVEREVWGEIEVERNVGFTVVDPVIETHEEEEEIAVVSEAAVVIVNEKVEEEEEEKEEKEEEKEEEEEVEDVKTMKDHIDIDAHSKVSLPENKKPVVEKSFWLPSVFAKKLQKWRRKQRSKKQVGLKDEKKLKQQMVFRETQSEIMDAGRRSCDTDSRFSLDAGRNSWGWEDPRYSWDEPRASWDGYLIGRVFTRPPVSGEDGLVQRSDNRILIEPIIHEDITMPGGTVQTRDYYSDSSSSQKRRRNLERSNSIRRTEGGEHGGGLKKNTDTKVTPAMLDDVHSNRFTFTEQSFRDSNSNPNSLRDEYSGSFDTGYRDAGSTQKSKSSRSWSKAWNRTIAGPIWGLIHKRSSKEDERYCRGNVVDRSFSESWETMRKEHNGDLRGSLNMKDFRCNSSVSSRSLYLNNSLGNLRQRSCRESTGISQNGGRSGWHKKRDEFALERNRSARYSPSHLDNGLLRFYLTPLRSSRSANGGASRLKHSNSFARTVRHLY